jgi:hypothetical protein
MRRHATPVRLAVILLTAAVGTVLWTRHPWPQDDPVVVLVQFHRPRLLAAIHWAYVALLYATPAILTSAILAACRILLPTRQGKGKAATPQLPPYPAVEKRRTLSLVIGECHHPTRRIPVEHPTWLEVPEAGLNAGVVVIGATGSGKTSAALYPFAEQLLGFAAHDVERRVGGLVLDVKGDVNTTIRAILARYGRADDHIELRLRGEWRYNPLHSDLDPHSLASGLASLIAQLYGRGPDPFWSMTTTNLVRFLIVLHRLLYGYVTFVDLYRCAIDPRLLEQRLREARVKYPEAGDGVDEVREPQVRVTPAEYAQHARELARFAFASTKDGRYLAAILTPELTTTAQTLGLTVVTPSTPESADRRVLFQLAAVERWYRHDWTNLHQKLRSSIVEGISVFLSLFDVDPDVNFTFCPPADLYANAPGEGTEGRPLPPLRELIDAGKVVTLNLPLTSAPGLARLIGTVLKLDFQHAVLSRIADMGDDPRRAWRATLCLIDEYHLFATAGGEDPSGDEKFLSLSRQARCMPLLATQSLSSLRAVLPGETWRALFQQLRTRIFLTLSDDFTAKTASELCGRTEQLVRSYNVSESAQRAGVSWLDAKTAASQATLTTSYSYSLQRQPTFEPRQFFELQNDEAIVLAYDGRRPHAPQYCYLRPHYLDAHTSHFTRLARAARLSRHATQP